MRLSLRETKIELFTKCHFLTSDKVFALHDAGPLRVKQNKFFFFRKSIIKKNKGGAGHQVGGKRTFLGRQKFLADGVAPFGSELDFPTGFSWDDIIMHLEKNFWQRFLHFLQIFESFFFFSKLKDSRNCSKC